MARLNVASFIAAVFCILFAISKIYRMSRFALDNPKGKMLG
jgi:hypothetical protein